MFYTMKQIVLLIATSLMLVAATIAVAIPNTVEAIKKPSETAWCYTAALGNVCAIGGDPFDDKKECRIAEAAETSPVTERCHKLK